MKNLCLLGLLSLYASLVWGGPSVTVGANPVARFCNAKGGEPVVAQTENDQRFSVCIFKGGATIEGMTLLNTTRRAGQAVDVLLHPAKRNSSNAEQFCRESGGESSKVSLDNGQDLTMCTFEDGSSIESTTLLKGPKAPMNKNLVKVILSILNK